MISTIISGALLGVSSYLVSVEVDIAAGLPGFSMVGSLGSEVRESRERVIVALKNVGIDLPANRVTVNLSPADIRKEGSAFDLPIAVGVLQALRYFPEKATENILFLGELGLNGEIKKVKGVLPIVREAAARGITQCIVPVANMGEGSVIPEIRVRGASNMKEVLQFLKTTDSSKREEILPDSRTDMQELFDSNTECIPDFSEVCGQDAARRAAEIAAAGFHNLLMVGPPGAGKSMIAKRIPGILPPLTEEESLEVTSVYSVAGQLEEAKSLITKRPFQCPHHTISQAALVGGSLHPKPGIVSLAHRGVLFLDELPEFRRNVLDSLRQPLEDARVSVARVGGTVGFPCDFMLVCAMNPCPCGYYPDMERCRCTETQVRQYMGKVSGPILDRIDLCVQMQPVDVLNLRGVRSNESSAEIRQRVMQVREIQNRRFAGTGYRFNSEMDSAAIKKHCHLGEKEQKLMEHMYISLGLSARAYYRILRVARTIADLAETLEIKEEHLLEASFYRPSTQLWG